MRVYCCWTPRLPQVSYLSPSRKPTGKGSGHGSYLTSRATAPYRLSPHHTGGYHHTVQSSTAPYRLSLHRPNRCVPHVAALHHIASRGGALRHRRRVQVVTEAAENLQLLGKVGIDPLLQRLLRSQQPLQHTFVPRPQGRNLRLRPTDQQVLRLLPLCRNLGKVGRP